jgi:AraC-type DNA-binding domain-containing proteins
MTGIMNDMPPKYLSMFSIFKCCFSNEHYNHSGIGIANTSIGYLLKGKAEFRSEHETFWINSGDIVYIPKGQIYTSHWYGSPEIEFYSIPIAFQNSMTYKSNGAFDFLYQYHLQRIDPFENSREKLDSIYDCFQNGTNDLFRAIGEFYLFYQELVEKLAFKRILQQRNPVQDAINYIEQHSTQEFTVKLLATLCNISESRFFDTFKKSTGFTPIEYKNHVRVQKGIELLSANDCKVEWVSDYLNFSSPAYFRKVFKNVTGVTPGTLKKQNRIL